MRDEAWDRWQKAQWETEALDNAIQLLAEKKWKSLDKRSGDIIFDLTLFVDQRVNIAKDCTLEEAIKELVPPAQQDAVRREYERWHR